MLTSVSSYHFSCRCLTATDGDILVRGSEVQAVGDATLMANEGQIILQAAENRYAQQSSSSSSSSSIGVGVNFGGSNGTGVTATASDSHSKGNSNAEGTTYSNTHIESGGTTTLQSGGDTTLEGAVVTGNQVIANVGGNLNITSLQDTNAYSKSSASSGFSLSMGKTDIDSNYQSV